MTKTVFVFVVLLASVAACSGADQGPCELACQSIDNPGLRAKCESKCEEDRGISQPQGIGD